ncbi:MAG TPA: cell envelope biogenesis protein OmpA, partial [Piscirickettsiaceae bacterium]|nr:cell envelope biogenesis protein OmpA [Piscirickettsiaceae bacterium]
MGRRHRGGHDEGGAHGGSWKIALADMMTVLMAFFLVMWLAAIVDPEKRAQLGEALLNMGDKAEPVEQDSAGPSPEKLNVIEELKPVTAEEIKSVLKDSKNVEVEETPAYLR